VNAGKKHSDCVKRCHRFGRLGCNKKVAIRQKNHPLSKNFVATQIRSWCVTPAETIWNPSAACDSREHDGSSTHSVRCSGGDKPYTHIVISFECASRTHSTHMLPTRASSTNSGLRFATHAHSSHRRTYDQVAAGIQHPAKMGFGNA